jgi:ketol-acid reductoisomerase
MVAPKSPGTEELKEYERGFGVPALIAIYKNETGNAKDTAMAMAHAMQFTYAGVLECTFEQEAYEDLFGEQTVLCGGAAELVKAGFETLTEAGYPPEMAYFECLHELKLIVDLMYEGGLTHMYDVVSNTAEFGGRTVGPKIIDAGVKERMKAALKDVESGTFAKNWMDDYAAGMPLMNKLRAEEKTHPIEVTGKEVRALFRKK